MSLSILLPGSESELRTEVFHKFKKGDRASFKTIFDYYYLFVIRFVHGIINSWEDAEDIAQDAFVNLWKTREQLEKPEALKAYLMTSSANGARNYLKKNKVTERYVREMTHTMALTEAEKLEGIRAEVFRDIEEAMHILPPGCRSVFEMIYFENLKTKEIATKLRITPRTVLNQKGKAIKMLRKAMLLQNNIALLELFEAFIRHR
ncbi:MAG: hypothetical protein BGO55_08565 [Sphingobacteriales bacterium 50-39]|nr:RNA polymerase sigma-70 factor [Sphingobacteriales bacterium]OJW59316.1 MAG: hypothetical protein BGO55_08565 [Sphingobacteriales bacterium 50-39]